MNQEIKDKLDEFRTFTKKLINQINNEQDLQDFWEESVDVLHSELNHRSIDIEDLDN